tara:strand:+ start:1423 stop:2358 length:936 start_codon:yes stop_codon:yes gene_type:complete
MNTNLSIGIPTYNQGIYLQETIDSILRQTVLPDEIVISNNFSDDDLTEKILGQYLDNKLFKILKPTEFLKMCSNWNFTAQNCSSKFFTLISSDDILEPNFVEEFINHRDSNCNFYRANFNIIDSKGNVIGKETLRSVPKVQKYPNNFLNQLHGPKAAFPAFIINKKTFDEVGMYNENFNFFADWHLLLKLSSNTPFKHINSITSNYRVSYRSNLNYDRTINGGLDDIIFTLRYLYDTINNSNLKKYMFFLKLSIIVHMSSYIKILKDKDIDQREKIENFLTYTRTKIEKNSLIIKTYKLILRVFELTLRIN